MERTPAGKVRDFIATVRQFFNSTRKKPPKQRYDTKRVPEELKGTYCEILDRLHMHIEITRNQSKRYHHISYVVLWTTPLLSALVTVLAKEAAFLAFYVSGAVTILTVLNSAIRPYETKLFAERYSNKFWGFRTDLRLAVEGAYLEEQDPQARAKRCGVVLVEKNKELCQLIEEFNKGPDLKGQEAGKK